MTEIEVRSSIDGSMEPSLLHVPKGEGLTLLVGLHTWSADRLNQVESMLPYCEERGWALLLPEFRGANLATNPRAPMACGSRLARQDVIDALDHVLAAHPIDPARVFLLGGSGGGHMALMMAAYAPERFRAISSWCPITDVAAWHAQNPKYAPNIAACFGGVPGSSAAIDADYRDRSPLYHTEDIARAHVSVHHGRFDPSVPYTQTWRLAQEIERLRPERFFHEIFDGKHEIHAARAFAWFDALLAQDAAVETLTG